MAYAAGMNETGKTVHVIPNVLYRDANAGIEWLKNVLGFTEHVVYRNTDGAVEHAELLFGNGMLMVGTAGLNAQTAAWMALPADLGGRNTGGSYLIVKDYAPLWQQALAAGVEVMLPLRTMDYGGQAFSVRDPDGHLWSVGEYDPWAAPAA